MPKHQTAVDDSTAPPHWAALVTDASLDRDAQQRQAREDERLAAVQLLDLVRQSWLIFSQRCEAELRACAAAVNQRLGQSFVDVRLSPTGALSIVSRHRGYVLIAPNVTEWDAPGVVVTTQGARWEQTPYRFVREGDQLQLWSHGLTLSPEAFIRTAAEPWLKQLSLGGR